MLPKPVAPNIWIVDGAPISLAGLKLPVRMTIIAMPDGLLLHSPVTHTRALAEAVQNLGEIRHLVAPSVAHWTMVSGWQRAFPGAITWAVPNLRKRRQVQKSAMRVDRDLTAEPPAAWRGEIEQTLIPGIAGYQEIALFHVGSRTLILVDLVQNLPRTTLPVVLRPLGRLIGAAAHDGRPPVYLRLIVRRAGEPAREAAKRLLAWAPVRVIFSHGDWFERDGTTELARALDWLLTSPG